MSQRLPTHGFKWLKDLTVEKVEELLNQRLSNTGFIFEVDLEYPKKLWESHNDYPLVPEKLKTKKLVGNKNKKTSWKLSSKITLRITLSKPQAICQSWDETQSSSQRNKI